MKVRKNKRNLLNMRKGLILGLVVLTVLLLSVGYSAFNTELGITGLVFKVRPETDIRVTGVTYSLNNGATMTYTDYNHDRLITSISLPDIASSVTYAIEITNIADAELAIANITGLPEELDYYFNDDNYILGQKICNKTGECNLGIKKVIYLTVKYNENMDVSTEKIYALNLIFEFQPFYSISYDLDEFTHFNNTCLLLEGEKGSFNGGDKYQCQVKDDMETGYENGYSFYVLPSTTSDSINLIMDRNICEDGSLVTGANLCKYSYNESGDALDVGPITAMEKLNTATHTWNNIQNLDIIYDDEEGNFTDFRITGKARMVYKSEVLASGCKPYNKLTCPVWMADYLNDASTLYGEKYQENPINGIDGYWTLSSYHGNSARAWFVRSRGQLDADSVSRVSYGIRPVITFNAISNDYQSEIIGGKTLTLDLSSAEIDEIKVYIDEIEITEYTFENGILTIPNVNGNVKIGGSQIDLVNNSEKYLNIVNSLLKNSENTLDGQYKIKSNGNLCLDGACSSELEVTFTGMVPLGGNLIISNNIVTDYAITYEYGISVVNGEKVRLDNTTSTTNSITINNPISIVNYTITGSSEGIGDKTKNLFKLENLKQNETTVVEDGVIYVSSYGVALNQTLGELCPDLKVGDIVTINADTNAMANTESVPLNQIYLYGSSVTWKFGTPLTITQEHLDSRPTFYCSWVDGACTTSYYKNFQIEYGESPMEYEPYGYKIPITVSGKNLFDIEKFITLSDNSKYYELKENGELVQKASDYRQNVVLPTIMTLKPGIYYISGSADDITKYRWLNKNTLTAIKTNPFTLTEKTEIAVKWWEDIGRVLGKPMVEIGEYATDYEPYVQPKYYVIYLDSPLLEGDYIDYKLGRIVRSDGTYENIDLPQLITHSGTNIISLNTSNFSNNLSVVYVK